MLSTKLTRKWATLTKDDIKKVPDIERLFSLIVFVYFFMYIINKSLDNVTDALELCYPSFWNGPDLIESSFIDLQQINPSKRPAIHFKCLDTNARGIVQNFFRRISGDVGNLKTCARYSSIQPIVLYSFCI